MRLPPRVVQRLAFAVLTGAMIVVALPVVGIVVMMIVKGAPGLTGKLFFQGSQALLPAIIGTVYLVLLTAAMAAPVGILAVAGRIDQVGCAGFGGLPLRSDRAAGFSGRADGALGCHGGGAAGGLSGVAAAPPKDQLIATFRA